MDHSFKVSGHISSTMWYMWSNIRMYRNLSGYKPASPVPPPPVMKAPVLSKPVSLRTSSPIPRTASPSTSDAKTPLPTFISQLKGLEWFDKYFPNANENVSTSCSD